MLPGQSGKIVATAKAVPTLTTLLGDERISQAARHALEAIPGPEASAALRSVLATTSGLLKAGVQLHAFPKDVMLAARQTAFEMYEDEARKNAVFKRIYTEWKKFALASDQWFKVAESPYANFMHYVK